MATKDPKRHRLAKGVTIFDLLDYIEERVVDYMSKRRGMAEKRFRDLLSADSEVCASYQRKIARSLAATGLDTTKLVG